MSRLSSVRIRILSIFLFIFASVVLGRLYFLQIVYGDSFSANAERQYVNTNTTAYDRGNIYFESKTEGLSLAAMTRSGFTLSIHPSLVKDPEQVYLDLSKLVDIDKQDFFHKIAKKEDPYEEIAYKINEETAIKIRNLKVEGLNLSTEKWRYYPGDASAANLLGFVSYNKDDELVGSYGLEKYYEDTLRRDPSKIYNNFFAELFSNTLSSVSDNPSQGDLVTSIDRSVQGFLEEKLIETVNMWRSDTAGGIIMNPMNGEIYAMSFVPSFNLNKFNEVGDAKIFANPLVEDVFEMGSIIKALTMASGIDAGVVMADSIYYDAGCLTLNNKKICNYDGRSRGTVSMQEILSQSLNTGATYVALKLGNDKFSNYFQSFGFGTETGIDLPNEIHGLTSNLESKRDIEIATASYGQGIAMTPIETIRALAALGNGGKLVTPHIVKRIEYDTGFSKKIAYDLGKQVFEPETSREITEMLVEVVDKALAGGKAKIPEYSIAAKTGTAQMSDEGTKGYVEGKYLHSFFGYFPAYEPKFIVFLFHTYPKGVKYASETLTQPFMDISKFLINYYEVPPDRNLDNRQ